MSDCPDYPPEERAKDIPVPEPFMRITPGGDTAAKEQAKAAAMDTLRQCTDYILIARMPDVHDDESEPVFQHVSINPGDSPRWLELLETCAAHVIAGHLTNAIEILKEMPDEVLQQGILDALGISLDDREKE